MSNILVTGCYGFIGTNTCVKLLNSGHNVIGVDKVSNAISEKKERVELLSKFDNFTFVEHDLQDLWSVNNLFGHYKPEAVIHLAGQYSVLHNPKHVEQYIKGNLVGFSNILEVTRLQGLKRFVYASSTFASNPKPFSMYGSTKLYNELQAMVYSSSHDITTVGLRYGSTYGPMTRPDVGIYQIGMKLLKGQTIEVGSAFNYRTHFIHIDDAVELTCRALDIETGEKHNIYTVVANDYNYKLMEILEMMVNYTGLIAKTEGKDECEQPRKIFENNKLFKDFNYIPEISMYNGIPSFMDWLEKVNAP